MSQYTVTHVRWWKCKSKFLCAVNFDQSQGGIRIYEECISELCLFNVLIDQRDATLLINDLYYPLVSSTCFGLSAVHHQEHPFMNCITHWYVRAGESSCCISLVYQHIETWCTVHITLHLFLWLTLSHPSCAEHGVIKTAPRYNRDLLQDTYSITFRIYIWLTQFPVCWIFMDLLRLKEPKCGTVCRVEVNNAYTFRVGLEINLHIVREMVYSSILSPLNKISCILLKRAY